MTTIRAGDRIAGWLALAAAPGFAAMALVSGLGGGQAAFCMGPGPFGLDAMTAMYLLMSLSHLPPWLRRAARRGSVA